MTRPAQCPQLPDRLDRVDTRAQALIDTFATYRGTADHLLASDPAMALEVAGNAANGIVRVVPDIDVAVAVKVHGVGAKAARHELRQAHGASIGAFEGQRVNLLFTGQQQVFAQLLAEEFGARRVIEAQGRQRVDHPVVAGVAAKEGLDTDDRNDHLGRHAVFLLGAGQGGLMLAPEVDATGDPGVGEEHRAIVLPGFYPFGRTRDRIEDRLLALNLAKHPHQLLTGKTVVAGHFADELGHLGRAVIVAGRGTLHPAEQTQKADPRRATSRPATHCLHVILHLIQTCAIHLRCVWIDIKTPNADSSVTNEVPP
ncbi:hypothetical protein D3C77_342000 [compost metagenome]